MEAFRVTCETCHSRLKIRSPEVIGEIHACPKCGSMVHILPPAGWTADATTPALAAAAVTAASGPALTISTSASTIIPADFAVDLPDAPVASELPANVVVEPQTPTSVASAPGVSPVVWWAAGSAVSIVAVGLAYALWPTGAERTANAMPTVAAAANDAPPPDATDNLNNSPPAPRVDPPAATNPDPYGVANSKDAPAETPLPKPIEPPAAATPESVSKAADVSISTPKLPETTTPTATDKPIAAAPPGSKPGAPPAQPQPAQRPDVATAGANAGRSGPVLKFDPLDFDPEHLNLPARTATADANSPPRPSTGSVPADAAVATKTADVEKSPAPGDLLPPPAEHQTTNVRRGPVANDPSRPLDAAQRLAVRVKSLHFAELPLARFAETLSALTDVPITLDPVTLELNGVSPRSAVSVDVTDATLDKVMRDAFSSQRLELVEQDGQAGIAIPNGNERRAADFDVKDLVKDTDAASIAKLIERFVAPTSWQSAGGKGTIEVRGTTLHIDHTLVVRREALIFCERLRLARGLPLRSKYPMALLTIDPPYEKLAATLNQPATFTFLAWTRLADVVRQWQELTNLTILVDWSALREAELGPNSPLACSTIYRPWTEALDGVLGPLGLGWWAVDEQTIQITTLDALEHIERVEFYPVPPKLRDRFATDEAFVKSLQQQIAERPTKQGKSGDIRIQLDEPSGRLIVRSTPDIQRSVTERISVTQD